MSPDPSTLLKIMQLDTPLIGFYDAPDPAPFEPFISPAEGGHACVFAYYRKWCGGTSLHLTASAYSCPGAGTALFGLETRSRQEYVTFLADDEGLKASHTLMDQWLDQRAPYHPQHEHLLIGPLQHTQYRYLKSVTFLVDPDQLSLLSIGAQYHHGPDDPTPVLAPFDAGCAQMVVHFQDLDRPQAIIGATDIAMRRYLPPDKMAFTVTVPLFEQLCALGKNSFLYKPFWQTLQKARKK